MPKSVLVMDDVPHVDLAACGAPWNGGIIPNDPGFQCTEARDLGLRLRLSRPVLGFQKKRRKLATQWGLPSRRAKCEKMVASPVLADQKLL